ncbi:MAG: hypothetical protein ABFD60_14720 [Bryobacteraceae bacterium]
MRSIVLFLLLAGSLAHAAEFVTGQAARGAVGQIYFTYQESPEEWDENSGSAAYAGGVSGIAYANDTLFVVDSNRVGAVPDDNRVLVYKNFSSSLPGPTDKVEYTRRCPLCVNQADIVLGQPNFVRTDYGTTRVRMRQPTAVATDGQYLVVADTNNNRVMVWESIPTTIGQGCDFVLGQEDTRSAESVVPPTATTLRGPQGVWIQNGMLFVADTMNHRVLIWKEMPKKNGEKADIVIGQPDFTTTSEVNNLLAEDPNTSKYNLLNPVSVTSDGTRMFVSDLGHHRVLIWNEIPHKSYQKADVVIGQEDMESGIENNSSEVCTMLGRSDSDERLYPGLCAATLSFPRYALSDGTRLFIADSGNDRVLVFNTIPTADGQSADVVLGQKEFDENINSDGADDQRRSSSDSLRTPTSLAWDGSNLYVSDPFNRRVLVFTPSDGKIQFGRARNAAGLDSYATGFINIAGDIQAEDDVTVTIKDLGDDTDNDYDDIEHEYEYEVTDSDTIQTVVQKLADRINTRLDGGDPLVIASTNLETDQVMLRAREEGEGGNDVQISVEVSRDSDLTASVSGEKLTGGRDMTFNAAGSLVTILGENLTDQTSGAPDSTRLPYSLSGVQVYADGVLVPLLYVSPTQVNFQLPWELLDRTSVSIYIRAERTDGTVTISNAVAVPIVTGAPGIFTYSTGVEPRPAVALHYSSNATGTISVDGKLKRKDIATVIIQDRKYEYTVTKTSDDEDDITDEEDLHEVRDGLVALINQDPLVEAYAAGVFNRIRLKARVPGPAGEGIRYSAETSKDSQVILTAIGEATCCSNEEGALVTEENPAVPGETVVIYATGLGVLDPESALEGVENGIAYTGTTAHTVQDDVSSMVGGKTANVLFAGLATGMVGVYEIHLGLNSDIPTNMYTQMYIAQDVYVSNWATLPVYNATERDAEPDVE